MLIELSQLSNENSPYFSYFYIKRITDIRVQSKILFHQPFQLKQRTNTYSYLIFCSIPKCIGNSVTVYDCLILGNVSVNVQVSLPYYISVQNTDLKIQKSNLSEEAKNY